MAALPYSNDTRRNRFQSTFTLRTGPQARSLVKSAVFQWVGLMM
jgi:hypothetical protein